MRIILLELVIFLTFAGNTIAATTKMPPLLPYSPYNPYASTTSREDTDTDYPKINLAEKQLFGKTYQNEDITNRLSRLEHKLFKTNYQYLSLAERTDNITRKMQIGEFSGISPRELSVMEQRIFMKTYPQDDAEMRITRLEKEIFGAMQGGDIKERFETLQSATKYYNAFPPKLSNQIPYYSNPYYEATMPAKVTLPSILRNIGSFFSQGALTGYSPNITYPNTSPYNSYEPLNNGLGGMQSHFSRPGFNYDQFRHYGQGSTVNILQD